MILDVYVLCSNFCGGIVALILYIHIPNRNYTTQMVNNKFLKENMKIASSREVSSMNEATFGV